MQLGESPLDYMTKNGSSFKLSRGAENIVEPMQLEIKHEI